MNGKNIHFIKRTASLQNTILFGLLFLVMALFIRPLAVSNIKLYSNETGPLDALFFYSPDEAFERMTAYGERGRQLYIVVELTADLVYAVVMAIFLSALLIWSSPGSRAGAGYIRTMILFPFAGMLLNWLENGGIIWMLTLYPEKWEMLAIFTSILTAGKWMAMAGCVLIAGWNLLQMAKARLINRRKAGI